MKRKYLLGFICSHLLLGTAEDRLDPDKEHALMPTVPASEIKCAQSVDSHALKQIADERNEGRRRVRLANPLHEEINAYNTPPGLEIDGDAAHIGLQPIATHCFTWHTFDNTFQYQDPDFNGTLDITLLTNPGSQRLPMELGKRYEYQFVLKLLKDEAVRPLDKRHLSLKESEKANYEVRINKRLDKRITSLNLSDLIVCMKALGTTNPDLYFLLRHFTQEVRTEPPLYRMRPYKYQCLEKEFMIEYLLEGCIPEKSAPAEVSFEFTSEVNPAHFAAYGDHFKPEEWHSSDLKIHPNPIRDQEVILHSFRFGEVTYKLTGIRLKLSELTKLFEIDRSPYKGDIQRVEDIRKLYQQLMERVENHVHALKVRYSDQWQ